MTTIVQILGIPARIVFAAVLLAIIAVMFLVSLSLWPRNTIEDVRYSGLELGSVARFVLYGG